MPLVYLDHNATTPIAPEVLAAMQPYLAGPYGNASSLHRHGRMARDAIERARAEVAALIDCPPSYVVWTSGGTESNNLAIKGLCWGRPGRVLYGATEHPSVLEAAAALPAMGSTAEVVPMLPSGAMDAEALTPQLSTPTRLLSLMAANNETGVLHDTGSWAPQVHAVGGWLHVDATQMAGKLPLSLAQTGADLLTLTSHKLFGPKGAAALVVRPEVPLSPLLHGGAQEKSRRGGTENLAAIVGFGAAAALARQRLESYAAHCAALRVQLERGIDAIPGSVVFGCASPRLPNTCQFAIPGWEGEALLMALDRQGYSVSSGSACSSGKGEPSHVLLAMGVEKSIAMGAVRISLGPQNTKAEVDGVLAVLNRLASEVRRA